MRLSTALLALPLAALVAIAPPAAAADETTRTLKLELAPTGRFAVENLAGSMRVKNGSGDKVVAIATIHGESAQIADSIRFEQVTGEEGVTTLRVIYPTDRYTTFRYPRMNDRGKSDSEESGSEKSWTDGWFSGWLGGSSSTTKYAGHKVKVSESKGVILYADVEVQLPRRDLDGTMRNLVGRIDGQGLEGTLKFDSASGDITLQKSGGRITADTGSGDIKATGMEGSFSGDTGSGNIDLDGFHGESIKCDTGSGDVSIEDGNARKIDVNTGSGDVRLSDVDAEDILADTGSGSVTIEASGEKLTRVKADTGSGDVTLRLGADASFEAMADLGSGDIKNHYRDAQPIIKDREVIGYRRGAAHTRIDVGTGSGNFVLEPGSY